MSLLEILQPGDSVGLAFGQRATLAVRFLGPTGIPTAGVRIGFAIVADLPNESSGGATLSSAAVDSDATGRATVDVVAGAAKATFRVRAQATGAPVVYFTVTVGNQGFVDLEARLLHAGDAALPSLHVRLYRGASHCDSLSPDAPPAAPYPVRQLATLDGSARFAALAPDESYALLATGGPTDGRVVADGCIDVGARQLRPGGPVVATIPLVDRPLRAGTTYDLSSTFDLAPLRQLVAGPGTAWGRAACSLGAAQLVLDCAVDALDAGDAADCQVEGPGPIARMLQAARGPVDADGCRPATVTAGGATSLDAKLMTELAATTATASSLQPAARVLADLLDSVALDSVLTVTPAAAMQRLGLVTLEAIGTRHSLDLRTTAHPVIVAMAPAARNLPGDELVVATLAYTLRLGDLVDAAFRAQTGLPGKSGGLGAALVPPARCDEISALVCADASHGADCLLAACMAAGALLDAQLAAPFVRLSGTAIDFIVEGSAVLSDADGDLVGEQLKNGSWDATARLSGGEEIGLFGVFQGTAR